MGIAVQVAAQPACPSGYVNKPYQDCPGAQVICGTSIKIEDLQVCGPGNLEAEVLTSCGTQETGSAWFQFKAQRAGKLRFLIIPNDIKNPSKLNSDTGKQDFDWVLFQLPASTSQTTSSVCQLLYQTAAYQRSCNFSHKVGITGLYDSLGAQPGGDSQSDAGSRFNSPFMVNEGDFFVLMIDNYLNNTNGYTLLFDDPEKIASAADVRRVQASPKLSKVTELPTCITQKLSFSFASPVNCQTINAQSLGIGNRHFPNQFFTIQSIKGDLPCYPSTSTAQQFSISFSPTFTDSTFYLYLKKPVLGVCGEVTSTDTLPFRIEPYLRLRALVNATPKDSTCCGNTVRWAATIDSAQSATPGLFSFTFFKKNPLDSFYNQLEAGNGYVIRPDSVYAKTACLEGHKAQLINLKVVAKTATVGCLDSAYASFKINPAPKAVFKPIPPLCFGESAQIAIHPPSDTSLYVYNWSSGRVPLPRLKKIGIFTLTADTINGTHATTGEVRRGRTDELKLTVAYKSQYGGCAIPSQKQTVAIGAFAQAGLSIPSRERPGQEPGVANIANPTWVFDASRFKTLDPALAIGLTESWKVTDLGSKRVLWSFDTLGPIDSILFPFPPSGKYKIEITLKQVLDMANAGKTCLQEAAQEVAVFTPQISNIMTPNGDGLNDYLEFPDLDQSLHYKLKVFNRGGRPVAEMDDYANTFQGQGLEPGTYFYRLAPTAGAGPVYKGWVEVVSP